MLRYHRFSGIKVLASMQCGCRESCGENLLAKLHFELDLYDRRSFTEKCADFRDRQAGGRLGTTILASVPDNTPSHCWEERLAAQPG